MKPYYPLVSIVIPVFNGSDFLKEAIESADIIVFLVAHKEFLKHNINDKIILNFCGIP